MLPEAPAHPRGRPAPGVLTAPGIAVAAAASALAVGALAALGAVPWPLVPALTWLAAISVPLTVVDLRARRLPNAIVLPSYPALALLLALASWLAGDPAALAGAAIGAAGLFGLYLLIALAIPRGMGAGDVKLAGLLGLVLGWIGGEAVLLGAAAAFLAGGAFSLALLLSRRAGRGTAIPFGPWMLLGAWLAILLLAAP